MLAISVIGFLVLLCIGRNLVLGTLAWKDRIKAKQIRNKERTRRQFSEARNSLVELAIARDIDIRSMSFRFFYHINTAFIRRPDQYRAISKLLVSLFLNQHDSSSGEELLAESKSWSPAVKSVVRATADALGYVVIDYSATLRFMFRLEKRLDPKSTPFHMLSNVRQSMIKRQESIAEIAEAREAMYQMADNPMTILSKSSRSLAHV